MSKVNEQIIKQKIIDDFKNEKQKIKDDNINTTCSNFMKALKDCEMDLMHKIERKELFTERTKEFVAETVLEKNYSLRLLLDCKNFVPSKRMFTVYQHSDGFLKKFGGLREPYPLEYDETRFGLNNDIAIIGVMPTNNSDPYIMIEKIQKQTNQNSKGWLW